MGHTLWSVTDDTPKGATAADWEGRGLTDQQKVWLAALVKSRKHGTADRAAGVSRMTAWRWRQGDGETDPMVSAYGEARRSILDNLEDRAMELCERDDAPQGATVLLRALQAFSGSSQRWNPRMDHKVSAELLHDHVKRVSRQGSDAGEEPEA